MNQFHVHSENGVQIVHKLQQGVQTQIKGVKVAACGFQIRDEFHSYCLSVESTKRHGAVVCVRCFDKDSFAFGYSDRIFVLPQEINLEQCTVAHRPLNTICQVAKVETMTHCNLVVGDHPGAIQCDGFPEAKRYAQSFCEDCFPGDFYRFNIPGKLKKLEPEIRFKDLFDHHIKFFYRWYDAYIGAFLNLDKGALYFVFFGFGIKFTYRLKSGELLHDSCPFCKSDDSVAWQSDIGDETVWCVFCNQCEAEGPHKPTKREAVAAWNNRKRLQPKK